MQGAGWCRSQVLHRNKNLSILGINAWFWAWSTRSSGPVSRLVRLGYNGILDRGMEVECWKDKDLGSIAAVLRSKTKRNLYNVVLSIFGKLHQRSTADVDNGIFGHVPGQP